MLPPKYDPLLLFFTIKTVYNQQNRLTSSVALWIMHHHHIQHNFLEHMLIKMCLYDSAYMRNPQRLLNQAAFDSMHAVKAMMMMNAERMSAKNNGGK